MGDPSIARLLAELTRRYQTHLRPYGSSFLEAAEAHGFGFTVDGIEAIFSAITRAGTMPANRFDVQIESSPPGEYIYTAEVRLEEVVALVERFRTPMPEWP